MEPKLKSMLAMFFHRIQCYGSWIKNY